jgi:hypothetical protein
MTKTYSYGPARFFRWGDAKTILATLWKSIHLSELCHRCCPTDGFSGTARRRVYIG